MFDATPSRRRALQLTGSGLLASAGRAVASPPARIRAVAFDAFPIFNPNSAFDVARRLVPGHPDLPTLWFQKAFADSWLRTSAGRYAPFDEVLAESLDFVAAGLAAPIDAAARREILTAFSRLDVWPDVRERLGQLKAGGLRLVFLSNMGEATLRANLRRNGIEALFDGVLSTDRVQAFKPAPAAYALGMRELGLSKAEVLFAPFAAWDAAGAAWFGYPTAWVNRARQPPEPGALEVPAGHDLGVVCDMALA